MIRLKTLSTHLILRESINLVWSTSHSQYVAIEYYKFINDTFPTIMKNLFEIKQTTSISGKSVTRQPVKSVFIGVNSLCNFGPNRYKSINYLNAFELLIKSGELFLQIIHDIHYQSWIYVETNPISYYRLWLFISIL